MLPPTTIVNKAAGFVALAKSVPFSRSLFMTTMAYLEAFVTIYLTISWYDVFG